jgi:hypothetical protein
LCDVSGITPTTDVTTGQFALTSDATPLESQQLEKDLLSAFYFFFFTKLFLSGVDRIITVVSIVVITTIWNQSCFTSHILWSLIIKN